jgi:hypothetical protein
MIKKRVLTSLAFFCTCGVFFRDGAEHWPVDLRLCPRNARPSFFWPGTSVKSGCLFALRPDVKVATWWS